MIEYERRADQLETRVRELSEIAGLAESRRREAVAARDAAEKDRDAAGRQAERDAREALRYREALERAVGDVAKLQTQVKELASAVDDGRATGRTAAILAGVAAAASVAAYLANEPGSSRKPGADGRKRRR